MAFLGSVARKCRKINSENRDVQEYRTPLQMSNFWNKTSGQNFLISGGTEEQRSQVLSSAIRDYRRRRRGPIIILNGSRSFESTLLPDLKKGSLGKAVVSSGNYQNYDLFYGLSDYVIRDLILTAARDTVGTNIAALGDYTEAFLKVLQAKYTPDFHSMKALADLGDQQIADFGASHGVAGRYLDYLRNGTAGSTFRRTLEDLGGAFRTIHGAGETGCNLSRMDHTDGIYLLWTNSGSTRLFNQVIARELEHLRDTRGIDYFLILNDTNLERNDPLFTVAERAKRQGSCGICYGDVISEAPEGRERSIFVDNFHSLVVLHSGAEDHTDQETILGKYGKYRHAEVVRGVGYGPGLFHAPGTAAPHAGMSYQEKQRVTVQDMKGFQIAVRGDRGDQVSLYRTCADFTQRIPSDNTTLRRRE